VLSLTLKLSAFRKKEYMSLEKFFRGSATAKILDILWEYQDMDWTLKEGESSCFGQRP
jgi:hypothetical protein